MFLFLSTLATGTLALALSSNLSADVVGEEERFRAAVYPPNEKPPAGCVPLPSSLIASRETTKRAIPR